VIFLVKINIEIELEHITESGILRLEKILNALREEEVPVKKKIPVAVGDEITKGLEKKINSYQVKTSKSKKGIKRTWFPIKFKLNIVKLYHHLRRTTKKKPEDIKHDLQKRFGLSRSTLERWLYGKGLTRGLRERKKPKAKRKKKDLSKAVRDKEIVGYCNVNPKKGWLEISKKFGLSKVRIYQIAKESGEVEVMKREWGEIKKPLVQKVAEAVKKEKPAEHFFKFKYSRVSQPETVETINDCIKKGKLSYREDAKKFGFDRRMLPTDDWFGLITEIAKKVQSVMGIEVTLDYPSGLKFKNS